MELFDVYPLFDITPVKGEGTWIYDDKGNKYMDFYGGHAVISIGHSHPHYVEKIKTQAENLIFYSNSVQNPIQQQLAKKLGELSGMEDYQLFLCNSGAEANENAIKLASFHTGRKKVVALHKGFHGRTSAAVAATDNPKIVAPVNANHEVEHLPMNDISALENSLKNEDVAALIIEGIQGVAGCYMPEKEYLQEAEKLCKKYGTMLIMDEVQAGYGRSGKFFSFQLSDLNPDIVTMAKGMGNGFPVGGILIAPHIKPWKGMLGTTFGGNHLASTAALAVLEVIENEDLLNKVTEKGKWLVEQLKDLSGVKEIRGAGLMIGLEFNYPVAELRKSLLNDYRIFTGSSGNANTLRLLPPLNVSQEEMQLFVSTIKQAISKLEENETVHLNS
ncbi:aspartate aminotransferase family protein [Marinigracilibium pacificum]|uniref:Aminotransferase class III-fold pyridoxal phosphate-dependent enzyme n=1 Tax=Marinigracilibium pacificum TaxID=2729599 RepID=A0A848IXK0_9BACT|nr:aminotransferase class III-fold pyridoxal phosphate-dependent enzyme [Marinigracilibium pacificum]NMM49027.1 aminotransferase class III-fold pyridoxal phosphate-dependent enzyme [Marinigracilibium pacificum]